MADFHSEATPMQFAGDRQEPNPLQWFRLEQWGKGHSSRLFYNEVPNPTWFRHCGHLDNPDANLYSFTHANQDHAVAFGIDTTTEEGRAAFKAEYDAIAELTPEIIKKENMLYPHEMGKQISTEPHFQRVWQHYREHSLKQAVIKAIEKGTVTGEDAGAAKKFLSAGNHLSLTQYALGKLGLRPELESDEGFLACDRVLSAVGMTQIPFDTLTAEPYDCQFWANFDGQFQLTEVGMREEIPKFIADPGNRAAVEAIMEERTLKLAA